MYQRGKNTSGARVTAMAAAVLLTMAVFSLVPIFNRIKLIYRSGPGGPSPVATALSVRNASDRRPSNSIQISSFELEMWESVPVGWIPEPKAEPKPVIEKPQVFEMPKLKTFELSDEARAQFVFNVDDLDSTPSPLYRKSPNYPQQLRRDDIEGRVVAEFRVDRDGQTHDIRIVESDHREFSASVVAALLSWRFVPGLVDGEPVEFRMRIPMVFRIVTSEAADPELFFASAD